MNAGKMQRLIIRMRCIVSILLFFVYCNVNAQSHKDLEKAVNSFNKALVAKDSGTLKKLLHEKLVYGHSNGWKETKWEMINNLYNGTIEYIKIEPADEQIILDGNTACVRATLYIDVIMGGKTLPFKLHGLQVWVKEKKDWVLLSRQSVKID